MGCTAGAAPGEAAGEGAGGVELNRDVTGLETEERMRTAYADKPKGTRSTGHPREHPRLGLLRRWGLAPGTHPCAPLAWQCGQD